MISGWRVIDHSGDEMWGRTEETGWRVGVEAGIIPLGGAADAKYSLGIDDGEGGVVQ